LRAGTIVPPIWAKNDEPSFEIRNLMNVQASSFFFDAFRIG